MEVTVLISTDNKFQDFAETAWNLLSPVAVADKRILRVVLLEDLRHLVGL